MQSLEELEKWIQPQHLEKDAIDRMKNLPDRRFVEGIVIDNFLNEKFVERFQHVFDEEAMYKSVYKVYRTKLPVSEEVFLQTPEQSRFTSLRWLDGVKPEYAMSPNWLTYLKFRNFYKMFFAHYLNAITGHDLVLEEDFTQSQQFNQYLRKHSDAVDRTERVRRICAVLYLSRDWKSEYGGELKMCLEDGRETGIEARCNRIVLFNPTLGSSHYVTRHNEIARDKTRTCHVAWYCDRV
jgi:hypothetical protein